ncbi:MAG: protein translocase subunit SecD, partial [Pseudomonadota bacterium]|nr:protein translocase subunit SecD [Pseudomonadota bacterium]MEC8008734.1 protein translocase subunit SecD [Pseudomonadota bacterium]MEC9215286.1 protein translocase subunit SecD [Pseudomonadota bacterium]
MLNRYPLWKNLFITLIVAMGFYYAAPNLYAPDPALQIGGSSGAQGINERLMERASEALSEAGIGHFGEEVQDSGKTGLIRLESREQQLKAQAILQRALGDGYIVALNLAPTTPDWLVSGGAQPMKLGLDLSGGVHFKLEVDVDAATDRKLEQYENGIKRRLREERIRGRIALEGTR